MAVDAFLWFEEIKGESLDEKHKDWIQLDSFSWGLSNPSTPGSGGGGGGGSSKATFQDFHFVSKISKASPMLFLSCASGKHIPKAVLSVRKGGDRQDDFLVFTLEDLLVSDFKEAESGGDPPTDEFSLNFSKIEFSYTPQSARGTPGTPVKASWDIKANKTT